MPSRTDSFVHLNHKTSVRQHYCVLQGAAAVTCGMCAKETLSISSLDYGAAALSLQRSITTVSGDVVEPRDITVELHSAVSPRQMLAVCMVLLMAGVDSSYGYVI